MDFLEPNIKNELAALGKLLHRPEAGVEALMYTDYSSVDPKEVARRGIGRVRPANENGEELRDVMLWLIALHYAKQSKTRVAFISGDKTFQDAEGALHHSLKKDIERAGVEIVFYRSVGEFVKGNALESEPLTRDALATFVSAEELRGVAVEQLLGSRFWDGAIVGAEVSQCELAEARQYRVAEDSYYVEVRYTGEGKIRIARLAPVSFRLASGFYGTSPTVYSNLFDVASFAPQAEESVFAPQTVVSIGVPSVFAPLNNESVGVPTQTTEKDYSCSFNLRLSMRIAKGARESLKKISLRDFRTVDAANLLADLHRSHGHGREMLKKSKAILSGIFTLARNLGALDAPNPIPGTMIPKKAAASPELHAASPEEVVAILDALENAKIEGKEVAHKQRLKAQAAVALQFFAGLRPGEARGARWEDYDGKRLTVCQSVWHTHTTTPKTEESAKPVPVIEPLVGILADLREADGNPSSGPILRGPSGKALNLENLSKRVVAPLLTAKEIKWHGWYSLRRGVATTIKSMSKDSLAAKGLLRHSSVTTTERHYIKDVPENTLQAMIQLEKLFNDCSTVKN